MLRAILLPMSLGGIAGALLVEGVGVMLGYANGFGLVLAGACMALYGFLKATEQ